MRQLNTSAPEGSRPDPEGKIHQQKHFVHRLESLRGLAALTVAVHHSLKMIPFSGHAAKIKPWLQEIFNGHGSVVLFFVLSGLVLGQSLRRITAYEKSGVLGFYTRRVLRIYPAYLVSLLVCALLFVSVHFFKTDSAAASPYYLGFYGFKLSLLQILSAIFLIDYSLNSVCWSLAVEMIGSLMLPFFHFLSRTPRFRIYLLCPLLTLAFIHGSSQPPIFEHLQYLWVFYFGYLIPELPKAVCDYFDTHRRLLAALMVFAGLICFDIIRWGHHAIPYTLSVGLFIAVIFHFPKERLFSFLDWPILKFYGRNSYSFYLLHWPVIYVSTGLMFKFIPAHDLTRHPILFSFLLALVSIGVATPLSNWSYHYVERPCMLFAKSLRSREPVLNA